MHMANELLSVPVAGGTLAIAAAGIGLVCRKAGQFITSEKLALMGILGAFVFAAQMVNFQLPVMPGTSGHMVGAVLLAIILGPHLAAIVISSVVIIQCLIFQDGGLLAIGCNIINMALIPTYLGYYLYRAVSAGKSSSLRLYIAAMLASLFAIEAGAVLVPIEASLSGVLAVKFSTFLITMLGVHFLVGIVEGLITLAVLAYLQQVRPDVVIDSLPGKIRLSKKTVLITFGVLVVVISAGLSLLACGLPDGLEWSYAERPDQPDFKKVIVNDNPVIAKVDSLQSRYTPMPDYAPRSSATVESKAGIAAGWTSFAGVFGSVLTMAFIWFFAHILRKNQPQKT
jgi:cobalt/nickel transport system permease protein